MEYFAADFHFSHNKILEFERTQFKSIKEHNNYILSVLENTLKNTDTLWFLGDFGFLTGQDLERFKRIDCKKYIIVGNHDRAPIHYKEVYGFEEAYSFPIYFLKRVVLSHMPIPVDDETINIHGHLHAGYLDMNNYINVNIHMLDYKLLSKKDILNKLYNIPKISKKFMEEWYSEHYVFTKIRDDVYVIQKTEKGKTIYPVLLSKIEESRKLVKMNKEQSK